MGKNTNDNTIKNPSLGEGLGGLLMTPDTAMQFMVWSYFYHDVLPEKNVSYSKCGKFSEEDVKRLDELKDMLFQCFEEQSVFNACKQFQLAKVRQEPCPFPQETLDNMFASEKRLKRKE